MTAETNLVSFVIRFVYDEPASGSESLRPSAGWRGIIRNVQTNDELHFVHWADAAAFISQYVNLDANPNSISPL